MKIIWRKEAEQELEDIFDYILEQDPQAAYMVCDLIDMRVKQLMEHPEMGRPGRVDGTRELVIGGTSYLVAYRVKGRQLDILAVLHGMQEWPEGF